MNKRVELFLEQEKKKQKERRNKHLISLGLVTGEKKRERVESSWGEDGAKYDSANNGYYKETDVDIAMEVTDEEYSEICRYCPEPAEPQSDPLIQIKEDISSMRGWIKFIGVVILIGLIESVIIGFVIGINLGRI